MRKVFSLLVLSILLIAQIAYASESQAELFERVYQLMKREEQSEINSLQNYKQQIQQSAAMGEITEAEASEKIYYAEMAFYNSKGQRDAARKEKYYPLLNQ